MLQHRRLPFRRKRFPVIDLTESIELDEAIELEAEDGAPADATTEDEPVITKHLDMFDVEANELPQDESRPLFALKPLPPVEIGRPSLFAVEPVEDHLPDLPQLEA